MNLHEYQGKQILQQYGVTVQRGIVAYNADEAVEAGKRLSQETGTKFWVVKAQIHAGGRGKGGGVKLAKNIDEEREKADAIIRMMLKSPQTPPQGNGDFIQALREQAKNCIAQKQPLSLIMLDIDFFKQYNDKFGHLVGDEVLINLCEVIRSHIKSTDAIGRWGGEEFTISLPFANGQNAMIVAERIRKTMASIKLSNEKYGDLPVPTISMGIAVFPNETDDIITLIDLADNRLYIAEERGRDQVEPQPTFWENTETN